MNDPVGLAFINQRIRPRAEQIRSLLNAMQDDRAQWFGGINGIIPNTAETVDDGRQDGEGVQQLTCAEVTTVMTRIIGLLAELEAANAMDAVRKACVRPPEVSW